MERGYFLNIIHEINQAALPSLHHFRNVLRLIYDDFQLLDGKIERVATGLNPNKHRWYETTTDVYKVGDWFLGVNGPSQLYSESSSWDDLCHHVVAYEMEAFQSVTYHVKD